jgi:hypothetical protein
MRFQWKTKEIVKQLDGMSHPTNRDANPQFFITAMTAPYF